MLEKTLLSSLLSSLLNSPPLYTRLLCSAASQQCLNTNEPHHPSRILPKAHKTYWGFYTEQNLLNKHKCCFRCKARSTTDLFIDGWENTFIPSQDAWKKSWRIKKRQPLFRFCFVPTYSLAGTQTYPLQRKIASSNSTKMWQSGCTWWFVSFTFSIWLRKTSLVRGPKSFSWNQEVLNICDFGGFISITGIFIPFSWFYHSSRQPVVSQAFNSHLFVVCC